MNTRVAFTYVELMIVAVVVAILFVVALPDGQTDKNDQGRRLGDRFGEDVAYAKSLNIARPDDPVIIKVDTDNERYWLAKAATPDDPIMHPLTGKPYLIQCGSGSGGAFEHVDIVAVDFDGDDVIGFDSVGDTDQETPAVFQISSGTAEYEVAFSQTSTHGTTKSGFTQTAGTGGTSSMSSGQGQGLGASSQGSQSAK